MSLHDVIRQHPAYADHAVIARHEGFALVRVSYREDHPDFAGGVHLEAWDDNDEYIVDVESKEEFEGVVDDVCRERGEDL
jgi:hypothetical protein